MKFLKALFVLFVIATGISGVIYYLTAGTIKSTADGIVGEIAVVAIPILFFLVFIYLVAKAVGKTAAKARKKSLPNKEGPIT